MSFYPGGNILYFGIYHLKSLFFLMLKLPAFGQWKLNLAPVPFRQVLSSPFSRFILYISCPRLKIINFLRSFGSYVYDVLYSLLSTSGGRALRGCLSAFLLL